MTELPKWARADGLPSMHIARAALHVGAIVGHRGSPTAEAQESYWHHATGGTFSPSDLDRGQRLLVEIGLLLEKGGALVPAPELSELLDGAVDDAMAALTERALALTRPAWLSDATAAAETLSDLVVDAARREQLLVALGRRFDDTRRRLVGEIGEELVIDAARAELSALGHVELARDVRRVSLLSDQLGYDISAPRIDGPARLLEVKATTGDLADAGVLIHLSRNEADTGLLFGSWALVVCVVDDLEQRGARVVGWCAAPALRDLLPLDGATGRWEQAAVELPLDRLRRGLPGVVA